MKNQVIELKQKQATELKNEDHGFALIEQAMRKCGVFENIVSTDYYGNIGSMLSNTFTKLTDKELSDLIDKLESEEE